MTEEIAQLITNIVGGPTTDGRGIVMEWTLGNGEIVKFAIPLADLPTVVSYMFNEAVRASEQVSREEIAAIAKPDLTLPMNVTKMALGPGNDDKHEVLHLEFGHMHLAFQLPTEALMQMAKALLCPDGPSGRN